MKTMISCCLRLRLILASKLALGTVQFGLNYGIANQTGQTNAAEVKRILEFAEQHRINCLDTAITYGNSEQVLGEIGVSSRFNVVSKLPPLPSGLFDIESWVNHHVQESLKRLKDKCLYGLLLHRSENLLGSRGKKLTNALEKVKSNGFVRKLGVSIYAPSELKYITDHLALDILQAPLNVVDRRLETSGWLSKLHLDGVEVHTRSAFLQGILLMPRDGIPVKFDNWASLWNQWAKYLKYCNISAVAACLSYPLSLQEVDRVVVGVDNMEQLKELIEASQSNLLLNENIFMMSEDQNLINPANWSHLR